MYERGGSDHERNVDTAERCLMINDGIYSHPELLKEEDRQAEWRSRLCVFIFKCVCVCVCVCVFF